MFVCFLKFQPATKEWDFSSSQALLDLHAQCLWESGLLKLRVNKVETKKLERKPPILLPASQTHGKLKDFADLIYFESKLKFNSIYSKLKFNSIVSKFYFL